MRRRTLLQGLLAFGGLTAGAGWTLAETAPATGRVLIVFLRGGLDGLFAFAPVADPRLAILRPTLASTVAAQGLPLGDTGFAAHPACAPLAELFHAGELSFAPCAGTVDNSRSHFQAQDVFELGSGKASGSTGFLARALAELGGRQGAVSFTQRIPLILQGGERMPEVAPLLGGLRLPEGRWLAGIRSAHAGLRTGEALEQAITTQTDVSAALAEAGMEAFASKSAPAATGFVRLARDMGRVLRRSPRFGLAFVELGGFDTHANQEPALARTLAALSEGLMVLRAELGEVEWRRTRVLIGSEFGRTAKENGTRGTDHGHGGLLLVAGGTYPGGRLLGGFDGLSPAALHEGRDLPVRLDWRTALADCLQNGFSLSSDALDRIFPGRPRSALG